MKKINLEQYKVEGLDEKGDTVIVPYKIAESCINMLLHPSLKLNGKELLESFELANKFKTTDKSILLEESDYSKLVSAVNKMTGFGKNDIEFVQRILNAETVDVKEKNKE